MMMFGFFFLRFLEIVEILLSFEISRDLNDHLQRLIKRHHVDYVNLFKDTLKPKHHLMIHYPNVILESGAPRHYWCFRYEAKHKDFKAYARNSFNRKNICVSLAKKISIWICSLFNQRSRKFFNCKIMSLN